jgi:hypothetical protein
MVSGGDELRRRYACDQCGYRSSRAGDMTKHINGGVLQCAFRPFLFRSLLIDLNLVLHIGFISTLLLCLPSFIHASSPSPTKTVFM